MMMMMMPLVSKTRKCISSQLNRSYLAVADRKYQAWRVSYLVVWKMCTEQFCNKNGTNNSWQEISKDVGLTSIM